MHESFSTPPQASWLMPVRVALLYAVFAALWIVTSGYLLNLTTADTTLLARFELAKGLAFVAVTSILLYLLVKSQANRSGSMEEATALRPGKRSLAVIFIALALAVPLIGVGIIWLHRPPVERETFDNLSIIADLKAKQIESWLSERIGDGTALSNNSGFVHRVAELKHSGSAIQAEAIRSRLELIIKNTGYEAAVLLDTAGQPLMSLGEPHQVNDATLQLLHEALTTGKVQHSQWRIDAGGEQHMDFIAPLSLEVDGQRQQLGAVLLHIDPLRFLQPYIYTWPGGSKSAETLLVRQEGDQLVFLNELQHRPGKHLSLPFSPATAALPAAIAIHLGHPGNVSGVDYRGMPVLAAYRPVKDTDWYLIAKIDRNEAFASVHNLAIWVSLIASIAAAAIGAAVLLLWNQQQHAYRLKLQLSTSALVRQNEARYRAATESAGDAIVSANAAGNIISWNPAAAHLFGYTEAEALGQPLTLLIPTALQQRHIEGMARMRAGGPPRIIGKAVELIGRHKEGNEFPIEVSLAHWQTDEGYFYTGILRNITERKRADILLRRQKDLYDMLSQTNQTIVRGISQEELFDKICRIAIENGGFQFAWIGLYDAADNRVKPVACFGRESEYIKKVYAPAATDKTDGCKLVIDAMHTGACVVSNNFMEDSTPATGQGAAAYAGVRAAGIFPIRRSGTVVGVLSLYATEPGFFSADVLSTLDEMATDISFALDNLDRSAALAIAAQVVEASPVVLYRLVPETNGKIEYVSENVRCWGYTAGDTLLGELNYARIVHADDLVWVKEEHERHEREGQDDFTLTFRIVTATGETLWVEEHTHIVRSAGGQVLYYEGLLSDITERKRASAVLEQRNTLVETILEHAPIGFAVNTIDDGNILFIGSKFEAIYGLPHDSLNQVQDFFDAVYADPEFRERSRTRVMADIESGDPARMHWEDIEFNTRDGKKRVINAMNIPLPAQNLMISAVQDVTAQFEAKKALRAAEGQFRGLVEQAIAGIYIIQDERLVYVNQRCAEIFGYAKADMLMELDPLLLIVESDRAKTVEYMQQLYDGVVQNMAFEFTALRQDGTMVDIGLHGAHATHHGRHAVIGLLQDISEKKRAEEQIAHYVKQLEGAFMRTVEVATTLSEMRDPYTAGHEKRVAQIAVAIGAEMGYDTQRQEGLRVAGYLHDVGKITIPAEILSKPGRLSPIEF
ncbi:MAG TPA: PAS domain S-box protein, partial [Rhodocyclaceae bacterium]|nr:PAS domain S-box protein [Rhodocyclaceae bacterium]